MYCNESVEQKLPYLTYKIKVRCKNLNPVKLSKKLNKLGYEPTRSKVGDFTAQKVWSNYTKVKNNQERKVEVTSLDIDNVKLIWGI